MSKEMYDDILKVVYEFGKGMEKKPSTYIGKDEESLRDQFLLLLETRYEGTTATGETFNRNGKTDIILKYAKDNSNLFIAECKIWKGAEEFQKAIFQLFDNYLTWRDSKSGTSFIHQEQGFHKSVANYTYKYSSASIFCQRRRKTGRKFFQLCFPFAAR
jgi:hypothetical protein